jgi:hypothetical protein
MVERDEIPMHLQKPKVATLLERLTAIAFAKIVCAPLQNKNQNRRSS